MRPTGEMTSMPTMPAAIENPAVAASAPDSVLYLERQVKRAPDFPYLAGGTRSDRRGIAQDSQDGIRAANEGRRAIETAEEI